MGQAMAADLTAAGKAGVATNIIFDAYSPSRAYQHYHGGVRILVGGGQRPDRDADHADRASSCARRVASTRERPAGTTRCRGRAASGGCATSSSTTGSRPSRRSTTPPPTATAGCATSGCVSKHAVETDSPHAFVIPAGQRDPVTTAEMLEVLQTGGVEIHEAMAPFTADSVEFPAGSHVVTGRPAVWALRQDAAGDAALPRSAPLSRWPAEAALRHHGPLAAAADGRRDVPGRDAVRRRAAAGRASCACRTARISGNRPDPRRSTHAMQRQRPGGQPAAGGGQRASRGWRVPIRGSRPGRSSSRASPMTRSNRIARETHVTAVAAPGRLGAGAASAAPATRRPLPLATGQTGSTRAGRASSSNATTSRSRRCATARSARAT